MPPLRNFPPQFLVPSWSPRQLRSFRRLHTSDERDSDIEAPLVSLFDELFPEKAKSRKTTKDGTTSGPRRSESQLDDDRHIPRLPMSLNSQDANARPLDAIESALGGQQSPAKISISINPGDVEKPKVRHLYKKSPEDKEKPTQYLQLRAASTSLVASDFRRLIPKGKHLDSWQNEGEILSVIPYRDPSSLLPQNHYLLTFSTPSSARAYYDHVKSLHLDAHTFTPMSLISPLMPSPGHIIKGKDIYSIIQAYTLKPPPQKLNLHILTSPLTQNNQRIIKNSGYPEIKARNTPTQKRAVLFFTHSGFWQPEERHIRRAIQVDGRNRGIYWELLGRADDITRLEGKSSSPDNEEAEEGVDVDEHKPPRNHTSCKWIITFKEENEAQRFIRTWHRRPFPLSKEKYLNLAGEMPLVNVELLW
ncbi:MAG: hypothetical protein M1829_002969 [Trizodia sp. TS-e1964]|nr:MAG: hypothetical protein M1829_002969 [Trizodia sp. TS-e1964]